MTSVTLSSAVRSLAEAAFSRSKAAVTPTSTPESVIDNDKDKEVVDPTSDAALSLSSSFPSLASFKDQRTFEHDRQRAKRSEEYLRVREAKASSPAKEKKRDASANSIGTRKDRRIGSDSGVPDEDVDVHDVLEGVRLGAVARRDLVPNTALNSKPEVKLVDLIKPGSIRKSRKNKDTDFEVVPAVRSVIVLDELAFMHDTPAPRDLEQEWEHVYRDDDSDSSSLSGIPTPTYANVLVSGLN